MERKLINRRAFIGLAGGGLASVFSLKNTEADEGNSRIYKTSENDFLQTGENPQSLQYAIVLTTNVDLANLTEDEKTIVGGVKKIPENLLPFWAKNDLPDQLEIISLNFSQKVQLIKPTDDIYRTPDLGIAADKKSYYPLIHIFGHSSWKGIPSEFRNIIKLKIGNLIGVVDTNRFLYYFAVDNFEIDDLKSKKSRKSLSLLLQTTAIDHGQWLIDEDEASKKVDISPLTYLNHANLYVWASPLRFRVPA